MEQKNIEDVMTTLFYVGWVLKLGYFPRSLREREISSPFATQRTRAPASASAVDAQHWMIPRIVNTSWILSTTHLSVIAQKLQAQVYQNCGTGEW